MRSFRPYTPVGRRLTSAAIIVAVLVLLAARVARFGGDSSQEVDRFRVVDIIDGDTFRVASGDKVRLANIDTPEFGEPGFEQATEALAALIEGQRVELRFKERRRDKYGRLVGYVFVDSTFVGENLLSQGLGYVYPLSTEDFSRPEVRRLIAAQSVAIDDKLGLWSFEPEPESYYVSSNGLRLHRPGCRVVRHVPADRLIRYQDRNEALRRGLSPCRRCRP